MTLIVSSCEVKIDPHPTYVVLTLGEKDYILRVTPKGKLVLT